ncbi:tetratricopeptide repeat protein [bacterium]|nr:tetratricopeptide repeat protein [bacterium]
MNYETYNSPLKKFFHEIVSAGNEVIQNYKDGNSRYGKFSENEMNRLGYLLIGKKKMIEAISIFKINVQRFPRSWNAHDSLAEAYMLNGDKLLAIQSYKKSLQLNPQNSNGTSMLKKLE